jgi:chaperonin GroEL
MPAPITFLDSAEFRLKVFTAIDNLSKAVGMTLGPGGRTMLLEQELGKAPLSTKDGVTVSRYYAEQGAVERVVVDASKEVCERTARVAGDGTTTAIVLAAAMVREGQEFLQKNPHISPQELSRRLKTILNDKVKPAVEAMAKQIKGMSVEDSRAALKHVAKVSANHDLEIAEKVAEAADKVGEDGMIIAEEGAGADTSVEIKPGFPITTGLRDLGGSASTLFVNNNAYGDTKIEGGAYVLLYDGEINVAEDIIPVMTDVSKEIGENGRALMTPLIIFAHRYSDAVLKLLAQNFRLGRFTCMPLITPRNGQAHGKQGFLHDLAAYVDGQVFDPVAHGLKEATILNMGFARSIKVTPSDTVVEADAKIELIEKRIADLKEKMQGANDFDQDRIRYRISCLTGGVAVVYAGGVSSFEAKERHARVVDAVSSVRSAVEKGVVPGGGTTLLQIAKGMSPEGAEGILRKAMAMPFIQILKNAGLIDEKDLQNTADLVGPKDGKFLVFDALGMKYVDWWEAGIMDPAKVTMTALDNSLSVAQMLMTLGGVIAVSNTEEAEKIRAMQEGIIKASQEISQQ